MDRAPKPSGERVLFCPTTTPPAVDKLCAIKSTNKSGLASLLHQHLGHLAADVANIQKWLRGKQTVPKETALSIQEYAAKEGIVLNFNLRGKGDDTVGRQESMAEVVFPSLATLTVDVQPLGGRNRVDADPAIDQAFEVGVTVRRGIYDEEFLSSCGKFYFSAEVVLSNAQIELQTAKTLTIKNSFHDPPATFFMGPSDQTKDNKSVKWKVRFGPLLQGTTLRIEQMAKLEGRVGSQDKVCLSCAENSLRVTNVVDLSESQESSNTAVAITKIREKLLSDALNDEGLIAICSLVPPEFDDV